MSKKPQATKVLGLLSQKGGSGKTTICVHLAVIAQASGLRVLIVDCDPQGSATGWWETRKADTPQLVAARATDLPGIVLAARRDGVALVIIDTRPSVEADTLTVARLADLALVPSRPSVFDLRAIKLTLDVLTAAGRPAAILLNAVPAGRDGQEGVVTAEARAALAAYSVGVLPVAIGQRAALAHALVDGLAVTEFDGNGKASHELRRVWELTEERLWPNVRR